MEVGDPTVVGGGKSLRYSLGLVKTRVCWAISSREKVVAKINGILVQSSGSEPHVKYIEYRWKIGGVNWITDLVDG